MKAGRTATRVAIYAHISTDDFDVVLVWKFDRFARSLRQLASALELFRKFGIDFVSATEAIDTSLPSGELVFQIFGAIAQFERALIGERVRAGLGEARRNGKRIGRPPIRALTPGRACPFANGAQERRESPKTCQLVWCDTLDRAFRSPTSRPLPLKSRSNGTTSLENGDHAQHQELSSAYNAPASRSQAPTQ